jgi:YfiH family protein
MPGAAAAGDDVRASVLHANWPAPPGVHALTTLRGPAGGSQVPFDRFDMGLRNGDDVAIVAANRALLARGLSLPSAPRWLRQVHGTQVHDAGAPSFLPAGGEEVAPEPEADAAVTRTPGTVLAILTADCLPVAFASADGRVVAAAHAGWRGLASGVLEATVDAMAVPPATLLAWLGPAAGPDAYEVGSEVHDAFVGRDPRAAAAFTATRPGHWLVDLYALARQRLHAAGLAPRAIHGGGLSTLTDPARFYSHRRDQPTGRMATLVWKQPKR